MCCMKYTQNFFQKQGYGWFVSMSWQEVAGQFSVDNWLV